MGAFATIVQFFAVLGAVGVIAAGAINSSISHSLEVHWCHDERNSECWTRNNAQINMFLYGVSLIVLGCLLFCSTLRVSTMSIGFTEWKYLGPAYMLSGLLSLGAASNTGIVVGAYCGIVGIMMSICACMSGDNGGLSIGRAPNFLIVLVQGCSVIVDVGVVITGAICIYSVVHYNRLQDLINWCQPDNDTSCWTETIANSGFALFCYGLALCIFGVIAFIADLKLKNLIQALHGWNHLGMYCIGVGICTLGASANTGLLCGMLMIILGCCKLLMYTFCHAKEGYTAI